MAKLRIALCLEDREYQTRFTTCIMNHYMNQFEIHVFTDFKEFLLSEPGLYHGIILSGYKDEISKTEPAELERFIYLYDEPEVLFPEKMQVTFVNMFQDVSQIIDVVLSQVKEELQEMAMDARMVTGTRYIGLYALSRVEYQMPFGITLGTILSERERVLYIDLGENSGLSALIGKESEQGLEELLVMAESGKYSRNRMMACIGKLDHLDYVYPAVNPERISETVGGTFVKMLTMMVQELEYTVIILNFGTRFIGLFELMNRCKKIFLLSRNNQMVMWREDDFFREIHKKGYELLLQRIHRVELPELEISYEGYERAVEQWKWNSLGEYVRKLVVQEDIFAGISRENSTTGITRN